MDKTGFAHKKNPLKRGGLSRPERSLPALDPKEVAIDGRSPEEMMQFIYAYARQVNYYAGSDQDSADLPAGDWLPFFQRSVPFQYARIAAYDLEAAEARFGTLASSIRGRLTFASLNPLFDFLFEQAEQLAQWNKYLAQDEAGLRATIEGLVETNLRNWFITLVGLANSGAKWGYRAPAYSKAMRDLFLGANPVAHLRVDGRIINQRGSVKQRVLKALDLLEEQYRMLWKGMEAVVQTAEDGDRLDAALKRDAADHDPHLGLLFAFLKLFERVQGSLNRLAASHLDFFYCETLKLEGLPHREDEAHLVFELAKQMKSDLRLAKGQRFKAGKDAAGADVFFELPEETILTQAKVAQLKTFYIDQGGDGSQLPNNLQGLYAAPVANSADGRGEEDFPKEGPTNWSTVGNRLSKFADPISGELQVQPVAELGFILASPVLWLAEGRRCIKLTIQLGTDNCLEALPEIDLFDLYLTTEEGWTPLPTMPVWTVDDAAKQLTTSFELTQDFPPVLHVGPDILEADYGQQEPMLKAVLNPDIAGRQINLGTEEEPNYRWDAWYWELRQQEITDISVDVNVIGLTNLVVQNDFAVMDPNKPFQPFGPLPKANSSKFYVGNAEVFRKHWEGIDLNIEWKDLPEPLDEYYSAYNNVLDGAVIPDNENVFVGIEVRSNYAWEKEIISDSDSPPTYSLFQNLQLDGVRESSCVASVSEAIRRCYFSSIEACNPDDITNGFSENQACGFLRLTLTGKDLLHDKYDDALIEQISRIKLEESLSLDLTKLEDLKAAIANNQTERLSDLFAAFTTSDVAQLRGFTSDARTDALALTTKYNAVENPSGQTLLPNPPYTPTIESISLNYTASDRWQAAQPSEEPNDLQLLHLHPWAGTYEQRGLVEADDDKIKSENLPIINTLVPPFWDEGSLYIGLENYEPGSNLQLYFAMDPSSADPEVDKAVVCWEYLRANTWLPLRADVEVQSDTTAGLIQSGIVKLAIPRGISRKGTTIMPPELHWLKVRVPLRTAAVADSMQVSAQGAQVRFVSGSDNDLQRLSTPLAAETIAKAAQPVAGLKGVVQPHASFGGRPTEALADFNLRVSEHLRHKGRAITISDYERLVLAEFPQVYRVKCLNHTHGRRGASEDYELCPGFVTLVVIPDLTIAPSVNPYEPRLPAADLQAIKTFLQDRISPFVRLEVLNPIYVPVKVVGEVILRAGKSENFYQEEIDKDLRRFLAPWTNSDNGKDISFGGQLYYSSVLKFLEERSYVDTVMKLGLQRLDSGAEVSMVITVDQARSVLTTINPLAGTHGVEILDPSNSAATATRGVGFDTIIQ